MLWGSCWTATFLVLFILMRGCLLKFYNCTKVVSNLHHSQFPNHNCSILLCIILKSHIQCFRSVTLPSSSLSKIYHMCLYSYKKEGNMPKTFNNLFHLQFPYDSLAFQCVSQQGFSQRRYFFINFELLYHLWKDGRIHWCCIPNGFEFKADLLRM